MDQVFELLKEAVEWIVGYTLWPSDDMDLARWIVQPIALIMFLVIGLELLIPFEKRSWGRQHWLTFTHFVMSSKVAIFTFVTFPAMQWAWIRFDLPSLHLDETWPTIPFVVLTLLVITFIDYWAHRILHMVPLL
ncbi:MAG: hypothetical protein R3195_04915 [Gemmatimonadota bacterium]|nr:hypothetical protein [Gemmatimonadota bacterium]